MLACFRRELEMFPIRKLNLLHWNEILNQRFCSCLVSSGETLPVVNVTQLEKESILVCYDSKLPYFLTLYCKQISKINPNMNLLQVRIFNDIKLLKKQCLFFCFCISFLLSFYCISYIFWLNVACNIYYKLCKISVFDTMKSNRNEDEKNPSEPLKMLTDYHWQHSCTFSK